MNERPFPTLYVPFVEGPFFAAFYLIETAQTHHVHVQNCCFWVSISNFVRTDLPTTDSSFRFRVSMSVCYLFGIGGVHGTPRRGIPTQPKYGSRCLSAASSCAASATAHGLPSAALMIFVISSFFAPSSLSIAVGGKCNRPSSMM